MAIKISLIAAVAANNVIGEGNAMPWHLPEDFRHFKSVTMGKPVLMGRKTYESIGKALPGRPNIVITRNPGWSAPGVTTANSLEDALKQAENMGAAEAMVIGGAQIYATALPFATSVYLTHIHKVYNGDAVFPALPSGAWREVSRQRGQDCAQAGMEYDFTVYERIAS